MIKCAFCNKEFELKMYNQLYCSQECYLENAKIRKRQPKKENTCVVCGINFIANRKDVKYCSDECRKKAYSPKVIHTKKICPICNKSFIPEQRQNQVYCSKTCHYKAIYRQNTEEIKKNVKAYKKTRLKGTPKGKGKRQHIFIFGYEFAQCSTCKNWYPISNFYKKASVSDGLNTECKTCVAIYQKKNKERILRYSKFYLARRRQKMKGLETDLSFQDWEDCLNFFDYKDAYTGLPMVVVSQDHIIPVTKQGKYTKNNIIPCESNINKSKGNRDMEKWFRKQPFFCEARLEKIKKWMEI